MNENTLAMIFIILTILPFTALLAYWTFEMIKEANDEKKLAIK